VAQQRGLRVVGTRTPAIWLVVAVIVPVLAALAVGGLVFLPAGKRSAITRPASLPESGRLGGCRR